MDIEKLKKEIEKQGRNGRSSIYVKIDDIIPLVGEEMRKKLKKARGQAERIFVDRCDLEVWINKYEEREKEKER